MARILAADRIETYFLPVGRRHARRSAAVNRLCTKTKTARELTRIIANYFYFIGVNSRKFAGKIKNLFHFPSFCAKPGKPKEEITFSKSISNYPIADVFIAHFRRL